VLPYIGLLPPLAGVNNTYKALRVIGDGYNLMYSVWCSNEHELYDMVVSPTDSFLSLISDTMLTHPQKDPGQVNNLLRASPNHPSPSILNLSIDKLQARLDALLLVLKGCKASSCTEPWKVLHPKGDVKNLKEALASKFDKFYEAQPKVAFSECVMGQVLEFEGPQAGNVYGGKALWPNWV
jgi:N-acetylglucosamine-6-sulfatase